MLTDVQEQTLRAIVELGHAHKRDLIKKLGVKESALPDRLTWLKLRGLIEPQGKGWVATPAGVRALPPLSPSIPSHPLTLNAGRPFVEHAGWIPLMNAIPLSELRALLRLLLGVAVLRQQAPTIGVMPWIGAYGLPGTGKTTIGEIALHLLGGELFKVGTMTTGEAIGRRVQTGGVWEVKPPRTLLGPVTVLDELAEAGGELQKAVFALVDLGSTVRIEGNDLEQRAAIFATWNPEGREIPLPEGAKRRGLLLNVDYHAERLIKAFTRDTVGVEIRGLLDLHPSPWFQLQGIEVQPLAHSEVKTAHRVLFEALNNIGRQNTPLSAVGSLGAAYAVMLGLSSTQALAEVVSDIAILANTRNLLSPLWKKTVGDFRAAASLQQVQATPQDKSKNEVEILASQAALASYLGGLLQRLKNARDSLQKLPDSLFTDIQKEAKASCLKELEVLSERIPHAKELASSDIEILVNNAISKANSLKYETEESVRRVRQDKEIKIQILESELRKNKEDIASWLSKSKRWRVLASSGIELGMQELEQLRWASRVQETQKHIKIRDNRSTSERVLEVSVGFLAAYRGVKIPKKIDSTPPKKWIDGKNAPISNPSQYLIICSDHAKKQVELIKERCKNIESDIKSIKSELKIISKF